MRAVDFMLYSIAGGKHADIAAPVFLHVVKALPALGPVYDTNEVACTGQVP